MLLVAYDIANRAPFEDIEPCSETLGIALVVTNGEAGQEGGGQHPILCDLSFESQISPTTAKPVAEPQSLALREIAGANPVGGGTALLEQIVARRALLGGASADSQPIAVQSSLRLAAAPCAALQISFIS